MSVLSSIAVAFSMYSRIPMPRVEWTERTMRYALAAFPLVGVVQGALCLAWGLVAQAASLPAAIAAAGLVVIPLAVNGGIHLDGFADTTDALASHAPRERKLEILKDSSIGAFAAIGLGCFFVVSFALLESFPLEWRALACLMPAFALSRALSGLALVFWPSARPGGTADTFSRNAGRTATRATLAAEAVLCAVALVCLAGALGAAVLAGALAVWGAYRIMALRNFGGLTGDLAGWFVQVSELVMTAVLVAGGLFA